MGICRMCNFRPSAEIGHGAYADDCFPCFDYLERLKQCGFVQYVRELINRANLRRCQLGRV